MKFSTVVAFAAGALAAQPIYREASLVERQSASTIDSDIAAISSAASSLDSAIKAFSGLSDSAAVVSASEAVVTAIKKATSDASSISALSQSDALGLVSPIQDLSKVVTTAVNDLIAKKSTFAGLALCGTVLSQVQSQQTAAMSFQTTLISKVPENLQPTAQSLAAPITQQLSNAANAFKSCPSGPATSSGSTGPTSSGTAPTSTAAPSSTVPGSFISSSTPCPSSTGVITPPSNGTTPTVPSTPTVTPNTNAGVKQAAGFGGLVLAAVAAVAAF